MFIAKRSPPNDIFGMKAPIPATDFASAGTTFISRLERSAEELSINGSDLEENIRIMHEEQKEKERNRSRSTRKSGSSRSSSTQDRSVQGEAELASTQHTTTLARNYTATASRSRTSSNSIVDVNSTARAGGFSPGGFITSPVGSVRSGGSWTHASLSSRAASGSKAARLAHLPLHEVVEPSHEGRPLDNPLAPSSSFSRRYDQMTGDIEQSLATIPPTPPIEEQEARQIEMEPPDRPRSADTFREAEIAFKDFDGVHYNPDTEEFVEVDQDGHEIRRVSARTSSGTLGRVPSNMRVAADQRRSQAYAPPPGEGMVYYPAPVPRMLNLPQRLSKQLPAYMQAQRRSQMLSEMPRSHRESAPWIPAMTFGEEEVVANRSNRSGSGSSQPHEEHPRGMLNQRMSMGNVQNLPPQLRASMFFEHPSIAQNVEVKGESAVATLDAILASSATAPVTAFTDHPFAGDVRKSVYAMERPARNRQSTSTTLNQMASSSPDQKLKKKRSSSIGNFFRRNSTTLDGETARPASRASALDFNENGNKLRKKRSQMSLGQMSAGVDLERTERQSRTPGEELDDPMRRESGFIGQATNAETRDDEDGGQSGPCSRRVTQALDDGDQIEQDFEEEKERDDWDLEEPLYAQPTTLLAELQVRKAQLKSRNRTAATAYPKGMHSTLLQLDAVEAIEAQKRKKKKIALAWEDPGLNPADDDGELEDNVPLGVLFPSKNGLAGRRIGDGRDWQRPLGLMEKREMEDSEPLAARRTRLNPHAIPLPRSLNPSHIHLAGQPDMSPPDEDEHEDETLGQRLRRLKTKDVLDTAISDVAPKNGDRPQSTFMDDVMSQFGGLEVKSPEGKQNANAAAGAEEEETLGQRRARLQREREISGDGLAVRPPLKTSHSMAVLLSSNPVGSRQNINESQAAQGTLLAQSRQQQMQHKMHILNSNMRASSYNLESQHQTGINGGGRTHTNAMNTTASTAPLKRQQSFAGLVGPQSSRPANGLFTGGLQSPPSQHMFGINQAHFASPTAVMSFNGGYGTTGYPQMQQQLYAQPTMDTGAYMALNGGRASMMPSPQPSGYNTMAGAGYGYASPQQQQMQMQSQMAGYPGVMNMNMMQMGMGMGMGMAMNDPSLDPNQRAAIDRWRMGVA